MDNYFKQLNEQELFPALFESAKKRNIPIITCDALMLIKMLIRLKQVKRILEIGTAIAYSSLHFASINQSILIDTIERKKEMIEEARLNLAKYDQNKQITLIEADALTDEIKLDGKYDLIFIDASKAHHQAFFLKYEQYLQPEGIIVIDNVFFHGHVVKGSEELPKRIKKMVTKIDQANHWLASLKGYHPTFLQLGDGLALLQKKVNI